jgi:Flp pilus assembly protein TadG
MKRYPSLPRKSRIKGQIAIITAFVVLILLGTAGLVIDAGVGYLIKAKLNGALDAAGIAAARAVSQGATQAEQTASAVNAAHKFFNANYPTGYLRSVPVFPDPVVTFERGKATIDLSATASVPVNMMGIFGFRLLAVSATAQTVRRAIDMAFVVDTTGSMQSVASGVRSDATFFLSLFNTLEDRVALIHFAYGAVVDVPFKADQSRGFDRATMNTRINGYSFNGNTNFAEGLWNARDQLKNRITPPSNYSSLRVIVFFSDGSPNTFASYFNFYTPANCTLPGSLVTGDGSTGTPSGLYYHNQISTPLPGTCDQGTSIISTQGAGPSIHYRYVTTPLPTYYNAHNKTDTEFRVVTATPRQVLAVPAAPGAANYQNTWNTNINRAARNLAESITLQAKTEGIYVYTLGLGDLLRQPAGPDNEHGENLLKCMANTPDSLARCYNPNLPVGRYCWAADIAELKSCFAEIASEILRLTK